MVDKQTIDSWYEPRTDISQHMTEKDEEATESIKLCEYDLCDGPGEYQEEFAQDDIRTVKCPCKQKDVYDDRLEYEPRKEL